MLLLQKSSSLGGRYNVDMNQKRRGRDDSAMFTVESLLTVLLNHVGGPLLVRLPWKFLIPFESNTHFGLC